MMKVIRFLLLCGFLCCGGYAHTSQAPVGYSANTVEQLLQANYPYIQDHQAFVTTAPATGVRKLADPLKATREEDDDDDDDFSYKHSGTGSGGIPSFYSCTLGSCSNYLTGRLPWCDHFSYISTSKFIIHCVIRI